MSENEISFKKWEGAVEVPLDLIDLDPLNPNVMSESKFSKLVSSIEKHVFDEPMQLTPNPDKPGRYLAVGGEHRYKACRLLNMTAIPAVIKETLQTEEDRYCELVRRNIDRGDLDMHRFDKLIKHLQDTATQPIPQEKMAEAMGFGDMKEFEKKLLKEKKNLEDAAEGEKKGTGKSAQIIDNVSYVLNEILNKYGQTTPNGYIFFCYKNRMHLMVQCDKDLYQLTHDIAEGVKRDNKELNEALKTVFTKVKEEGGFKTAAVDFEYTPDSDDDLGDLDSPKDLLEN